MSGPLLPAGSLTERVVIEYRPTPSLNAVGENTAAWSTLATVWAAAEPLRGDEYLSAGQLQQTTDVRFRMRWRSDVTPAMRVQWRGGYYDIVSVINVEGHRIAMELMCVTGKRDGR